jgi:membrane-associated protein
MAESIRAALTSAGPLWLLIVVGALVFLETGVVVAFFLPGDSLLFAAGMVVAVRQDVPLVLLIGIVCIASVVGDQVGYRIGRRYGRTYVLARGGPRIASMLGRSERFYARYGWTAIVLARFYPWLRGLVPPVAGMSDMSLPVFASANVVGAVIWGSGITALGYFSVSMPILAGSSRAVASVCVAITVIISVRNYVRARRA